MAVTQSRRALDQEPSDSLAAHSLKSPEEEPLDDLAQPLVAFGGWRRRSIFRLLLYDRGGFAAVDSYSYVNGLVEDAAFSRPALGHDLHAEMLALSRRLGGELCGKASIPGRRPVIAVSELIAGDVEIKHLNEHGNSYRAPRNPRQSELPEPVSLSRRLLRAYGGLGDAREVVARLRTITSAVIPDASFPRNPEHRELYLSGLRLEMGVAT